MSMSSVLFRVSFAGSMRAEGEQFEKAIEQAFMLLGEAATELFNSEPEKKTPNHKKNAEDLGSTVSASIGTIYNQTFDVEIGPGKNFELFSGYAEGADRAAIKIWKNMGMGSVHALFPYMDDDRPEEIAWTHGPFQTDQRYQVGLKDEAFDKFTVLDGAAYHQETPARSGHLEQSRWLVRWADIVIVAWDGKERGGVGGTADTVEGAFAKNIPIIWIDLSSEGFPVRLIDRQQGLPQNFRFSELLGSIKNENGENEDGLPAKDFVAPELAGQSLANCLKKAYEPVKEKASIAFADLLISNPKYGPRSCWECCVNYFDSFFGKLWSTIYSSMANKSKKKASGEKPLQDKTEKQEPKGKIETAFNRADGLATKIGNSHRGLQIFIFLMALLAVLSGTLPAVFPDIKKYGVTIEIVIILIAFGFWTWSKKRRSHEIWSEYRYLSERLRGMQATLPLGFDIYDGRKSEPSTWMEWYSNILLRQVGPPTGALSNDAMLQALDKVTADEEGLIKGQISYNEGAFDKLMTFHHRLHRAESTIFAILVAILVFFLAVYFGTGGSIPDEIGGAVLMVSAILPLVGAVFMGLEAKLGLLENASRCGNLQNTFSDIKNDMSSSNSLSSKKYQLRRAAFELANEADNWRQDAARRIMANL